MSRRNKEGISLNSFIADTLDSIVKGIIEARQKETIIANGVIVCPKEVPGERRTIGSSRNIYDVTFELSLNKSNKGGLSIAIPSIGRIGIKKRDTDASLNKVKFTIPILYPDYTNQE